MSSFKKIGLELREGFNKVPLLSTLSHLDVFFIFGALAYWFLMIFVSFGVLSSIIGAVVYEIFILGLLFAWANKQLMFLYAGLFGYAGLYVIYFLRSLFSKYDYGFFTRFNLGYLVTIAIFGGLGWFVFNRSKTGDA